MHDRRIDDEAHTFGVYGGLYRNAMTWYDHETNSIWSQPIGTAMAGHYKGVRLEMVPAEVLPWSTWKKEHPDSLVLDAGGYLTVRDWNGNVTGLTGLDPFAGAFGENAYVLGAVLGELAKAYLFDAVSREVVLNDRIGDVPVLVYANPEDRSAHIYVRRVGDVQLQFGWAGGRLTDAQTGSLWNPANGLATDGPLKGRLLKEVPYATAYLWAWRDFYPDTDVYGE